MLTHIHIRHFAIIESLDLDIKNDMTVLTGETGAGKSILLDAIELTLGQRANSDVIKNGHERADIAVAFDINDIKDAQTFLENNELSNDNECVIRRIIQRDGRSKNFINGTPSTLQQLRELGELLVNIHGQHEFQTLLKRDKQRQLVDDYAEHPSLLNNLMAVYKKWRDKNEAYEKILKTNQDSTAHEEFLKYQIKELDELGLGENEIAQINQEHKQLANADTISSDCQLALTSIDDEQHSAINQLNTACQALEKLKNIDDSLQNASDLLNNAALQTNEACHELKHYFGHINIDPARLTFLDERLRLLHTIARKHHVQPKELFELHQKMQEELNQLEHSDECLQKMELEINQLKNEYFTLAKQLTKSRSQAGKKLSRLVTQNMQQLGMPNGQFEITFENFETTHPLPYGLEKVNFMVNANPGQPLQSLAKIASGGELSRISLAVQVIAAKNAKTPTLFFDEVDVGIGGATAEIVGTLLRNLSEKTQVFCVTHLAQVAAKGKHHICVEKINRKDTTQTKMNYLNNDEKIQEIARMMGGVKITKQTLEHAKEMVEKK